jgi:Cys-tRNA(Pro)/Cys-tRNA(Cys) deacylase
VGTPALAVLRAAGIDHVVHQYPSAPGRQSFGAEAAAALGIDPARVLKTLVATVGDELVVGVVPVTGSLDLKALAAALGAKRAAMADPSAAERSSGYVVGAISPIGQRRPLRTVIDESALRWPTVCCSAGRRGLEVELAPGDLVEVTSASVAPIAG